MIPSRVAHRLVAACCVLAAGGTVTTSATAQGTRVSVESTGCDGLPIEEARRVVAVELGATAATEGDTGVVRVTVTCTGSDARIVVNDPLSRKTLDRRVALGVEDLRARGRLLGVAIAELVIASWTELATNPEPRVPSADPSPPPEALKAAREVARVRLIELRERPQRSDDRDASDRSLRIAAVGSRRAFFSYDGALWGGGVRVGQDVFKHIGWSADALFETGKVTAPFGELDMKTGTVGGALFLYQGWGPLVVRAGAGVRVGVISATSVAQGASTATPAPWGWPTGNVGLTLQPVGPVVLEVAGEIGYVVIPVAAAESDSALKGTWFGLQVGLGLAIPKTSPKPDPAPPAKPRAETPDSDTWQSEFLRAP